MESIPVQPNSHIPVRLPVFAVPLIMHDVIQRFITHFGPQGMGSTGGEKAWSLRIWKNILGWSEKSTSAVGLDNIEEGASGHGVEKRYGGYGNTSGTWQASGAGFGPGQAGGSPAYATTTRLRTKKLD